MNIFNNILNDIKQALNELTDEGVIASEISFTSVNAEPPRDSSHGDIATNAAMVIAKAAKKNPRELAQLIAAKLEELPHIKSVNVAGPGFINLFLNNDVWYQALEDILESKADYGNCNIGQGAKVNVEYVSANPTGPMHIGHARGAVYGDALSLLLKKAGFNVTKEYYINDAGSQIETLAKSAYLRYLQALGEDIGQIPEGLYPGEYLKTVGNALANEFGNNLKELSEEEYLPKIRQFCIDAMMEMIRSDLKLLGIEHDIFSSEKHVQDSGKIDQALKILQDKGLIYQGVLEPPKGKLPDDWEPREQTLFKASEFGDDVDRALKKSDGSYTYFASDIAYHLDKMERGFDNMTLILGADHGGYIKRMKAVIKALSDDKATIDVKLTQLVNFIENGQPMKMSKRAGTFTTVRDVVEEVGKDVVRFIMLTRKNDAVLDFDLDLVKEQSKDNPIFYVQYANARANSVMRNAKNEAPEAIEILEKNTNKQLFANITSDTELRLIKFMASWPRAVEAAAKANEPHRISFYLQELAAEFHSLWNKGKDDTIMRFIIKDKPELTAARLALLEAMMNVIESGLSIFAIEPMKEM